MEPRTLTLKLVHGKHDLGVTVIQPVQSINTASLPGSQFLISRLSRRGKPPKRRNTPPGLPRILFTLDNDPLENPELSSLGGLVREMATLQ